MFFFLIKLRTNLKQKILNIDNRFKNRENILNIAIMQKKNLKRNRENNNNSNFNFNFNSTRRKKSKNNNKFQQQQQQFC